MYNTPESSPVRRTGHGAGPSPHTQRQATQLLWRQGQPAPVIGGAAPAARRQLAFPAFPAVTADHVIPGDDASDSDNELTLITPPSTPSGFYS